MEGAVVKVVVVVMPLDDEVTRRWCLLLPRRGGPRFVFHHSIFSKAHEG